MNDLFIILFLIVLNGVFSMSEIALISAKKSRLSGDAKHGSKSARTAIELAEQPDRFLSTVQIGITLIGILTGIYSGDALADDFAEVLALCDIPANFAHDMAQFTIILVVTFLSIVVGELVPKRIGMNMADSVAKLVALPMKWLSIAAHPFVWLLSGSTSLLVRVLGISKSENKVTEEEIREVIQEGAESGEVLEVEQDIMERALALGDMKIASIQTHRTDLVTLDIHASVQEIKDIIARHAFDAYPVVDGTMDNVLGLAHLKDLAVHLGKKDFSLKSILRPATFYPKNTSVYKMLEAMRKGNETRAIVCDEFGGTSGIVTLRDILEGLVGTLDERTDDPDIVERTDGQSWLVDGQCPIYDFLAYFDKEFLYGKRKYTTVSGIILNKLERIPQSGESIEWEGFRMEIVDMDGIRIDKVLVTITPP